MARRLTCQVRQSVTVITGYLPENYQPEMVRERLVHARQFSEDLYHSFMQVSGFEVRPKKINCDSDFMGKKSMVGRDFFLF